MSHAKRLLSRTLLVLGLVLAATASASAQSTERKIEDATYTENEIYKTASAFFGMTTEGLAKAIEKVFSELGQPNAFIAGEEVSGAIGVGVRYGNGMLHRKTGQTRKVYWQGPTIGFDFGADVSKVFVLIYHMADTDSLFQRFPAIDGSFYFIAGVGVNYQKSGDIVQAPIRTGVGLRAGVNVGYMHYTREHSWIPL